MRPSDKRRWLQVLLLLSLVTAPICGASVTEKRWETADLIVEGRITETTYNGETQVSTLEVDRVLKTETLTLSPAYAKGYASISLQVPANTMKQGETNIVFLEETPTGYDIIYSEKTETSQPTIDPGISGLIALTLLALATIKIKE